MQTCWANSPCNGQHYSMYTGWHINSSSARCAASHVVHHIASINTMSHCRGRLQKMQLVVLQNYPHLVLGANFCDRGGNFGHSPHLLSPGPFASLGGLHAIAVGTHALPS